MIEPRARRSPGSLPGRPRQAAALVLALCAVAASQALPAVEGESTAAGEEMLRRERLLLPPPRPGRIAEPPSALPPRSSLRAAWEAFGAAEGGPWQAWIDRRSGAPLLVEGQGIDWTPPPGRKPIEWFELEVHAFLAKHLSTLGVDQRELVLSPAGSGAIADDRWILLFDRVIEGMPVRGQQIRFYIVRGRMAAFGATGWGAAPKMGRPPALAAEDALLRALEWMGPEAGRPLDPPSVPRLILVESPAEGDGAGSRPAAGRRAEGGESAGGLGPGSPPTGPLAWTGEPGEGIVLRPAWEIDLAFEGDPSRWQATIDAETGEAISVQDLTAYDHHSGGVYPRSNDGVCPLGCQQPAFPMPFTEIEGALVSDSLGFFRCVPGFPVASDLLGIYTRVSDVCGPLFEESICGEDFPLGAGGGTDCAVPPGASPGNTAATRTIYHHLNRIQEKARYWLPGLPWHDLPLLAFANFPETCNAFYNGAVVFFASGGGCANVGELGGVVHHEYGHGLDEHDGGGFDNSTEAYADVAALLQTRRSCIGEGFFPGGLCGGFGDACLTCNGVREMDWAARKMETPATPAGFILPNCPPGFGACGRRTHCESYVATEAIFDLATRDLPAMGIDSETAWQLTERLWYTSRLGSGGDIFNCSLPLSDGCAAGSWFLQLRMADDDDGNLANGTPHAAAIFAAFDRHAIACGTAASTGNRNSTICPVMEAPHLEATRGQQSIGLTWTPVPGATGYRLLRTEIACDSSQNVISTAPASTTAFAFRNVPYDLPLHYRVQPLHANSACDGPVSNCASQASQPFAATLSLDREFYSCGSEVEVTVYDGNIESPRALLRSTSEPAFESVDLEERAPLSARYVGRIATGEDSPSPGDGRLAVSHGETITARYRDLDDGTGGQPVHEVTAAIDCVAPGVSGFHAAAVDDRSARVEWSTSEPTTGLVRWGELVPPSIEAADGSISTGHSVLLTGLQPCTRYWYVIEARDRAGNVTLEGGAAPHYFETPGRASGSLMQCRAAVVALDAPEAGCTESLGVRLTDMDMNTSPLLIDHAPVTLSSSTETLPEILSLRETGPNTSVFTGSITLAPGTGVARDNRLQARHDDVLTAAFADADDGTGAARNAFATGRADCLHDGFLVVTAQVLSDAEARVSWTTRVPASGRLEWGPTPDLGHVFNTPSLKLTQAVEIEPLEECGPIWFRIISFDSHGNKSVAGEDEGLLSFNGPRIPGAIFLDGFEKSEGWTLEGEWEIGAPAGSGLAPDDPAGALFGSMVLGHDLSGLGAAPRRYETSTDQSAISPPLDATALRHGELRFYRWLNSGDGARATVEVQSASGWVELWEAGERSASVWSPQILDISTLADGNPELRIRFRQRVPFTLDRRGGWNLDRLVVRDGSLPPFEACGGCAGAPSMAGLASAVDLDPCAEGGLELRWSPAASWGTGTGGSYAIYRGKAPGFQPGPASLVAAGIVGLSFVDASAPAGTDLFYLVQAENDERCSTGPANGGLIDGNRHYVAARDSAGATPQGGLGDLLAARDVNGAHVRLEWPQGAGGPEGVTVVRAGDPRGPFSPLATVQGSFYEDLGEGGAPEARFYLIEAAPICTAAP